MITVVSLIAMKHYDILFNPIKLFQKAYLVRLLLCFAGSKMCFNLVHALGRSNGILCVFHYVILSEHHLLQLFGRPQWLTVRWRSHTYVNKVKEELEKRGCQLSTGL
ncbi:uncharacterized protein LOC132643625 [Lycium barbarum]|uniref:uncharacterized protein LOC132643625 n=1 Tax=Lycium barbarum TaxID=112863 RepID=UPI00293E7FAA|nr:uncharacterized protein LOC132643625 [Lycium barbarum]